MRETPPWYVLTGGPSAGKSTLLKELAKRGYATVSEAARHVIEEEIRKGRTLEDIRGNAAEFQRTTLRYKLEWEAGASRHVTIFFDRGIPDSVAYYRKEDVPEDEVLADALARARYRKVFILDLISRENFAHDGVRSESWEEAQKLDRMLEEAYREQGYDVVRVPVMSVEARTDFILQNV